MAKREIELFSISFLDLLCGALAAVLILFIIIPKEKKEHRLAAEALEKFNLSIGELDSIIKNSVNQQVYDEVAVQFLAIRGKINKLGSEINLLEGDKEKCEEEFTVLKVQYEELLRQLKECMAELENCHNLKVSLGNQNMALKGQLDDYKFYYDWMKKCSFDLTSKCPPPPSVSNKDLDVGFKFRGKNIVFVVDVSGSMSSTSNDYKEDRLSDLKGGLKMLIATIDPSYKFDLVHFPNYSARSGKCTDYAYNWGYLNDAVDSNKTATNRYILKLEAGGATPTRSVLKYVLNTYKDASDIILLTDGAPTNICDPNFSAGVKTDDIHSVVSEITALNTGRVKISCVGIGREFYDKPTSDFVIFLKDLSAQNGGFFVGF